MFDQDRPQAREKAKVQTIFRDIDDPNHVFIVLEYGSVDDARVAQAHLLASGVLDRFEDRNGPDVVLRADADDR